MNSFLIFRSFRRDCIISKSYKRLLILFFISNASDSLFAQNLETIGKQKLFDWNGGIALATTYYNASGIVNRRDPFFWQLSANLNFSFLGGIVQAPFSFVWSQQNKSFVQPQPFNRFGLSPSYRDITLHLGHRSMNFSDYTLAGNIFFGVGLEYESSKIPWRASALYGRLAKAVPRSATSGVTFVEPSYRRLGYGTKIGYKKKYHEIDFILFRAYDDAESIPNTDSLSISAQENVVLGLISKIRFLQNFSFNIDYAYSLFTRDRNAMEESINEYSFVNNLGGLFKPTNSSSYTSAITTGLAYNGKGFQLNANYRRVDPEFITLGSAFLNNDLEDISGGGSISILNNRVTVTSNAGIQRNNLDNQLTAKNSRFIFSSSINWAATQKLQMSVGYGNFNTSTRQSQIRTDVLVDSLEFFQVSRNGNLNINYTIGPENPYMLNATASIQDAEDNSGNSSTFLSYNAGLQKNFNKVWSLGLSITANNNQTQIAENLTTGTSLTASRSLKDGKFRISLVTSFLNSYQERNLTSSVTNFRLNGNLSMGERHNISISSFYLIRSSETLESRPLIREFRGSINYNFRI